jgi:hypothetical protein
MTTPTHTDLQRDFGRMEGRMDSLDKSLTQGLVRIENALGKINSALTFTVADANLRFVF